MANSFNVSNWIGKGASRRTPLSTLPLISLSLILHKTVKCPSTNKSIYFFLPEFLFVVQQLAGSWRCLLAFTLIKSWIVWLKIVRVWSVWNYSGIPILWDTLKTAQSLLICSGKSFRRLLFNSFNSFLYILTKIYLHFYI